MAKHLSSTAYDAIIVGAGSAGCVLANLLSATRHIRVLLLEAGPQDTSLYTKIPVGYYKTQMNPKFDWCLQTAPIPGLNQRSIQYPRGRILGGSSSVNGMLYVRPQSRDFQEWSESTGGVAGAGTELWSNSACLERFEKIEETLQVGEARCNMVNTDAGIQAFMAASKEIGVQNKNTKAEDEKKSTHLNLQGAYDGIIESSLQEGYGMLPVTVSPNGLRRSASAAFLPKEVRNRKNLDIVVGVTVNTLSFAAETTTSQKTSTIPPSCDGVSFSTNDTGTDNKLVTARLAPGGEVIVAAGTIGSPHLLLRSGIGDPSQLKKSGVHIVHDLPHVGQNMQDHCQIKAAFRTFVPSLNDRVNSSMGMLQMGWQFLNSRTGPLTMTPTPACAFARAGKDVTAPDVQLLYGPWTSRSRKTTGALQLFRLLDPFSAAALTAIQLRPTSRGYVGLQTKEENGGGGGGSSVLADPVIQPHFLDTPKDEQAVIDNLRLMCTLGHSSAMQGVIDRDRSVNSEAESFATSSATTSTSTSSWKNDTFTSLLNAGTPSSLSDERLLQYARRNGTTVYHPVGTCKMGRNAHDSVVDTNFQVHGVKNLSVVDASIMPSLVSANTNATTMMIGMAGAERIQQRLVRNQQQRQFHSTTVSFDRKVKTKGNKPGSIAIGLDFGTESVRAVLVDISNGNVLGDGVSQYARGQITGTHPAGILETGEEGGENEEGGGGRGEGGNEEMPSHVVLQDSQDWWESATAALSMAKEQLAQQHSLEENVVVGIGSCFTACTPVPCLSNGTPLHELPQHRHQLHSWPKLWKYQASDSAALLTESAANAAQQNWLEERYGGAVGAEWMHAKALDMYDQDRTLFEQTDAFVDAGDWFVHEMCYGREGDLAVDLHRSSCQAGFKGCWGGPTSTSTSTNTNTNNGFPAPSVWNKARSGFGDAMASKYEQIGHVVSPGDAVGGGLCSSAAERFGLREGTPVSVSTIDAHCGVPGVGVGESGVLVMVMGTSGCYMLNSEVSDLDLGNTTNSATPTTTQIVSGCLGRVENGILPGYVGMEMGQSAMGDLFAWLSATTNRPISELAEEAEMELQRRKQRAKATTTTTATSTAATTAARQSPLALDWFNGCRSPYNDGALRGGIMQLDLSTTPGQLYLAVAEGLACGARQMVSNFVQGGAPVHEIVAAGGLPHVAPLLMQTFANALQRPIRITETKQSGAVGAAIFGAVAGGSFKNVGEAVKSMSRPALDRGRVVEPDTSHEVVEYWKELHERYLELQELELRLRRRK